MARDRPELAHKSSTMAAYESALEHELFHEAGRLLGRASKLVACSVTHFNLKRSARAKASEPLPLMPIGFASECPCARPRKDVRPGQGRGARVAPASAGGR